MNHQCNDFKLLLLLEGGSITYYGSLTYYYTGATLYLVRIAVELVKAPKKERKIQEEKERSPYFSICWSGNCDS